MIGLLNKYIILISFLILFASCVINKNIKCANRDNLFSIQLPENLGRKFILKGKIDNGDLLIYENAVDSLTLLVYSSFNNPILSQLFTEKYYQTLAFNYNEEEKDITINLEQNYEPDKVIKKYLFFNRIDSNNNSNDKYEVSYIFVVFDRESDIRVELKRSFPVFDLESVLEWCKNYGKIKVAHVITKNQVKIESN